MYLEKYIIETFHFRNSKLGKTHKYSRKKTILKFRCDNCNELFLREKGDMDPKRLNNNYFHCCSNCDAKKFAQTKGSERKTIWDWPASRLDDISKL